MKMFFLPLFHSSSKTREKVEVFPSKSFSFRNNWLKLYGFKIVSEWVSFAVEGSTQDLKILSSCFDDAIKTDFQPSSFDVKHANFCPTFFLFV